MNVISKRNGIFAFATLVIALGASSAIWGLPKFLKRSTTTTARVSAFLLDEQGKVNGLLLENGDQLHFSPETGVAIATRITVGDEVSASGHAGSQSSYGRGVRVEQISSHGQTIIVVPSGPPPRNGKKEHRDHAGPDERWELPSESVPPVKPEPGQIDPNARPTDNIAPAPIATPEIFRAAGTIRAHLVNDHGDVDGLILTGGEQVRFPPRVGKVVVAAQQGGTTQVNIEGTGIRNDRGVVIRPTYITVGNQTISLER